MNDGEKLAKAIVELIKNDEDVRSAVIACVRSCPNVVVRI